MALTQSKVRIILWGRPGWVTSLLTLRSKRLRPVSKFDMAISHSNKATLKLPATDSSYRPKVSRSLWLMRQPKLEKFEPLYGVVVNQTFTVPIEKTEPSAGRIL